MPSLYRLVWIEYLRVRRRFRTMFLAYLVKLGLWIIKIILYPTKIYFQLQSKKYCPPIENKLLKIPATKLAEKIRNSEVSSFELIQCYISRIKQVNPVLNAVVKERFEEALLEAKSVDKMLVDKKISKEDLKRTRPFLGIPFTVKESIALKGMCNRAGSVVYKRDCVDEDSDIVKQMKVAGAIPLLVSNTPELCMNWETFNNITGRTLNPYDTRRTCGGSSGGEAALLSSGASLIGLGSDLCGSLRIPAYFCGIWGHKPTPRTVSYKGHFPNSTNETMWPDVFTVGPMSRYAVDLPAILNTICKKEDREKLNLTQKVDLKDIKFYYMTNNGGSNITTSVDKEIVDRIETFVKYLRSNHGIEAEMINISNLSYSPLSHISFLQLDGLTNTIGEENTPGLELLKYHLGMSKCSMFAVQLAAALPLIQKYTSKTTFEKVNKTFEKLREKLLETIGPNGVFLYPTYPTPAHFHMEIYHRVFDTSYMAVFNILGLPSTNCTLGLNSEGLPIGMQVISAPYNDRLTFRVAAEVEKCLGGWVPPPTK